MLLEQIKELAEIEFNEDLNKFIKSKEDKIKLFMSPDASKYNKDYLDFLNDLIRALSLEEKDIKTEVIRQKRAMNQEYSIRRGSRHTHRLIEDVDQFTTVSKNVIIRLHAFIEKLEPIRNQQQLMLQAQSLVESTNEEVPAKQRDLTRMQGDYLNLLSSSNSSLQSFVEFERNLDLLFNEDIFSKLKEQHAKRTLDMNAVMQKGKATSAEGAIKSEQSKLDMLTTNFESIMKQATVLKNLTALLKRIKNIEVIVMQIDTLQKPSDAQKLQELIQLLENKEQEIQSIRQEIEMSGSSKEHQQTVQTINNIEKSIQQKREHTISLLEQISITNSKSQQKEEQSDIRSSPEEITPVAVETIEVIHQSSISPSERTEQAIPQGTKQDVPLLPQNDQQKEELSDRDSLNSTSNGEQPPMQSDQLSEKALEDKRKRLEQAISLIIRYKGILKDEKEHSLIFFHPSRNQAKIDYCSSLEQKLREQIECLTPASNLHNIINQAHIEITNRSSDAIIKGGSYFGTSRMLSLQRLLSIDEAWKKGHSKFLGFSTSSDFHGLKASGMVGEHALNIVNNFYNEKVESDGDYQTLKKQVFPEEAVNKSKLNP
ncbi:hypothetical protein OQJ13_15705 [Legionella sp. PATHC035]|uniref:hypothetical protein n=1 Tax=Legionella sp. PATHC035 TaxID=2992040 RepID=UPI00224483ED|nr:hypothetical protein [Legionella sp. PATHC035]MCW8410424.1 hypothetical protein [Legionella sp. PATHC035]